MDELAVGVDAGGTWLRLVALASGRRIARVTATDVMRVAARYLAPDTFDRVVVRGEP